MKGENNVNEKKFDVIIGQIDSDYKGYNLQKILAIEVALLLLGKDNFSYKSFFKIFMSFSYNSIDSDCDNFFVIGKHGRKDYLEIINYVIKQLDGFKCNIFDFNKVEYKLHFSLSSIYSFFKDVFRLKELSWKNRLLLSSKICFYKNNIGTLDKVYFSISKCKNVVLFSSVHPWEGMLHYFFSKRNMETYSLQHGVYFIFKESKPIDFLLYKNFIAHKHLCWGEYTKKEFSKYGIDEGKLLVAGYPRNINSVNQESINSKKCIVFLTRKVLSDSNFNLLRVLKDFVRINNQYKFYLKLHPSLNPLDYKSFIDNNKFFILKSTSSISQILSNEIYKYSICVYTTVYYEVYLNGLVAFRYHDGSSELSEGVLDDIFSNTSELDELFKAEIDKKEIQQKLEYIIGYNVNNYKTILGNV